MADKGGSRRPLQCHHQPHRAPGWSLWLTSAQTHVLLFGQAGELLLCLLILNCLQLQLNPVPKGGRFCHLSISCRYPSSLPLRYPLRGMKSRVNIKMQKSVAGSLAIATNSPNLHPGMKRSWVAHPPLLHWERRRGGTCSRRLPSKETQGKRSFSCSRKNAPSQPVGAEKGPP